MGIGIPNFTGAVSGIDGTKFRRYNRKCVCSQTRDTLDAICSAEKTLTETPSKNGEKKCQTTVLKIGMALPFPSTEKNCENVGRHWNQNGVAVCPVCLTRLDSFFFT